jgi:phosphoribosylanthranilate isomerase
VSLQHTKVKVKVCGVTSLADTLAAMGAGADLIGFNFVPASPRYVTVDKAAAILKEAPKGFQRVGVFKNAPPEEVAETAKRLTLHAVQLHGDENPEDYRVAGVPIIKSFAIGSHDDVKKAKASSADFVLLDSVSALGGGSGTIFDWTLLIDFGRDYFLAGGLNSGNVADAIERLHPYGVDVCSGVEREPGKKNKEQLKLFLSAARDAEAKIFAHVRGR